MIVNYKFQVQIKIDGLNLFFDRSFDLEISSFNQLSDFHQIESFISDVNRLYFCYKNLPFELLAKDLDYIDLNFLLFLRTIEFCNFDNVLFDGNYYPIVGIHGKGFDFEILVKEG